MRQLGGDVIMLTGQEMQLGRGETIADTARVLSRYVDAIMIRISTTDALAELAEHATVPVINGLTRRSHPCQIMADVMTFEEHRGPIARQDRRLDRRRQQRAGVLGACGRAVRLPAAGRDPRRNSRRRSGSSTGSSGRRRAIHVGTDPDEAVEGADCVVTDTWVSMGDGDGERRHNLLKPYQVNARLMARGQARCASSCIACRPIAARK